MVTTRSFVVTVLLLAPLTLGAQCSVFGLGGPDVGDLDGAKRLWRAAAVDDYTFVLRRNCFCGGGTTPVRIVVRNGVGVSYTVLETGEALPEEWRQWYPTVEGLFAFLEDAVDRDAERVDVRYHSDLGYPVTIFVDYEDHVIDEEMGYEIQSFRSDED